MATNRRAAQTNRGTIRISMEISPAHRDLVEGVRDQLQATSLTDVFRKALAVFAILVKHVSKGGKVVLENKDGTREAMTIL